MHVRVDKAKLLITDLTVNEFYVLDSSCIDR
jgi:hypothetical protein